jgi:uncharacterized protein
MAEYLAPGVYVEEVSFRSKSVEGVGTSTCGFVGPTRKGPYNLTPELITSYGEYQRVYGGFADLDFAGTPFTNYMAHAVRAFFDNGGRRLYVSRTYLPKDVDGTPTPGFACSKIRGDVAEIKSRFAGSGYNGKAKFSLKTQRVFGHDILNKAIPGTLLRIASGKTPEIALPARIKSTKQPLFTLEEVEPKELTLTISGGDPQTITFSKKLPAQVTSTENLEDPIKVPAHTTFTIKIGEKGTLFDKEIILPEGDQTPAQLAAFLNLELDHAKVGVEEEGNRIFIRSDERGEYAEITITELPLLKFAAGTQHGNGNVDDINRISIEEINSALAHAGIAARATTSVDGYMFITTIEVGAGKTISIKDSGAKTPFGLNGVADPGKDGVTYTYYVKDANTWKNKDKDELSDKANENQVYEFISWSLAITDSDGNQLLYDDLGFGEGHPNFIAEVLRKEPKTKSEELQNPYFVEVTNDKTAFDLFNALFGTELANEITLKNGDDGVEPVVNTATESATDHSVAYAEALQLFSTLDDIAIIAAPGHSEMTLFPSIQEALISHAERDKYCIAVLDTPPKQTPQSAREAKSRIDSSYAALYYPWVTVANPLWKPGNNQAPREIDIPPSGFIAGIYARTDVNRGVWKAPANEVVRGTIRFESDINHAQQEMLNPEGINCLRFFFGRGYRVWGARTASSDPEWKYVNVRRYFIYLEHSIDRSTQWAVFEPNGPRLWANITDTISAFLYNEWRSGALLGTTPEQAYFVRCDRSTMTQADLDNGRLICEIGVAALKPAEFVIFRIGQKTADAK